MANVKKTVAWFIAKKALIKFAEGDDSYTVADNVMKASDFEKYPISKGDTVEVSIEDEEVTFMKKDTTEKKEEPKTEAPKEEVAEVVEEDVQTFVVEGVFTNTKENKKSVKFKDEKINGKKWTVISEELAKSEFKDIGLVANNSVSVVISDGVITKVTVLGEVEAPKEEKKAESKTEAKSSTAKKYSTNSTGSSIERQCALKGAVEIVKTLLETKTLENNKVKEAIVDLTKVCYKAIQEA